MPSRTLPAASLSPSCQSLVRLWSGMCRASVPQHVADHESQAGEEGDGQGRLLVQNVLEVGARDPSRGGSAPMAATVAARGAPSSSESSPKWSPGINWCCWPSTAVTRSSPSSTMWNESPGSPARTISAPSA